MTDKPFYLRSHFWLTVVGIAPGVITAVADAIVKATGDGTLNPADPLYPLFIKVAGSLIGIYTFASGLKYAAKAFGESRSTTEPVSSTLV